MALRPDRQRPARERLQPALLDRLRDDAPDKKEETRAQRVINLERLRTAVLRDLQWLLETTNLAAAINLEQEPEIASSVLNYGLRGLAGQQVSGFEPADLERLLHRAISDFEPRILPRSLEVRVIKEAQVRLRHDNIIALEIKGDLWAQPTPERLYLRTELDLESGQVQVGAA
jgi:type VI secretion system protein ImpF